MAASEHPPPDMKRLVGLASSGDPGAADALLLRYLPSLVAYIRREAGDRITARESVADLAQSVCREVLEQLKDERLEYRDEAGFRGWLFQAALRKVQMRGRHWRREKRDAAREVPLGSRPDAQLGLAPVPGTPSADAMSREEQERIDRAFARLEPRQQEIIRLARHEGLTHREIAARLQIQESHSRTLLARALAHLARLVAEGQ